MIEKGFGEKQNRLFLNDWTIWSRNGEKFGTQEAHILIGEILSEPAESGTEI